MNFRRLIGLISIALLTLSLRAFPQSADSKQSEVAPQEHAPRQGLTIPFELYDDLIFVPVRINSSGPRSFLLDTGASTSFLNETLADSLGLGPKRQHKAKIGTGEASTRLGFAKGVALSLPGLDLPAQTVAVVPLSEIESVLGRGVDGIVGADLFKRYVVTIDYIARTVTLDDPKTFTYHGKGEAIPLRLSGNRPFFKASVTPVSGTPIEAEIIIDTGDDSTLAFHTPFVEKHNLRASNQKMVMHVSHGVSGESRTWRGRVNSFQVGRFVIDHPTVTFSEATKGSEADRSYDGVLGGEILRRFSVTLDYSRHQMILETNASFTDPYESDMSGVELAARGKDFKTIIVQSVRDGSPAVEAGIKQDDIIETVDNKAAGELGLEQIERMFRQDGSQYMLGVRRGKDFVQVTIKVRRLI